MVGEFNVRNAAMAVAAARFYRVSDAKIDNALKNFKGIARRQEMRGEARGVKVIDDFGGGRFSNRAQTQPGARYFRKVCRKRCR